MYRLIVMNMKKNNVNKNVVVIGGKKFNKKKLNNTIKEIIMSEIVDKMNEIIDEFEFLDEMGEFIINQEDLFENCEIRDNSIYLNTDGNEFGAFGENSFNYEIGNGLNLYCSGDIIELSKVA